MTINGGTFTKDGMGYFYTLNRLLNNSTGKIIINDGTFDGSDDSYAYASAT